MGPAGAGPLSPTQQCTLWRAGRVVNGAAGRGYVLPRAFHRMAGAEQRPSAREKHQGEECLCQSRAHLLTPFRSHAWATAALFAGSVRLQARNTPMAPVVRRATPGG